MYPNPARKPAIATTRNAHTADGGIDPHPASGSHEPAGFGSPLNTSPIWEIPAA
jgi:hypothetical protein